MKIQNEPAFGPRQHNVCARLSIITAMVLVSVFGGTYPGLAEDATAPAIVAEKVIQPAPAAETQPKMPPAPEQVAMPVAPSMRFIPGLEEPLVANGLASDAENKDLDEAVAAFKAAPSASGTDGDFSDYAKPLIAFIDAHPESVWNVALLTNLGLGYYHGGYYSRAITAWEKAWKQGQTATTPQARALVDRAVGELAQMHSRLGHEKELTELFTEIGKRPIGGPATERIQGAREGLWSFQHNPGMAYLCGPHALKNVLLTIKGSDKQLKVATDARSGAKGFNLAQLSQLSTKAGLKHQIIFRKPGEPVPVPSIINWNSHHYAAIIEKRDGLYIVKDPTFGDAAGAIITQKAIDAEGSGYFLVPTGSGAESAKTSSRVVSPTAAELKSVYGMGVSSTNLASATGPYDTKIDTPLPDSAANCASCGQAQMRAHPSTTGDAAGGNIGMTVASAHAMVVSLNLTDTPVGYRPQKGLPAYTTITYNQREAEQPANFSFSNLSPKWSHTWMAYIQDDPVAGHQGLSVRRVSGGGGGFDYSGYNSTTGALTNETPDYSQLVRTPTTGTATQYTRTMPDGSKEIYSLSDGAASYPRRMFLTSVADAQGNTTTINYDGTFRITTITDAMGRNTTFSYTVGGSPLLITKITDPFGRFSQMTYDGSGRLATITDPVGITSTYTYGIPADPNFVSALTTPYGTSNYSYGLPQYDTPATNSRALLMSDPMGYKKFVYYYQNPAITPATDTVPSGMSSSDNGYLNWRNTYYWDAHAYALGVTSNTCGEPISEDFSKAYLTHWYHDIYDATVTGRAIASIKPALEKRLWFDYWNQPQNYQGGTFDHPKDVGRIMDDGSSQVIHIIYTTTSPNWGLPTQIQDPYLRATKWVYAANNVDVTTVQQYLAAGFTTVATYGSYNSQHEPQTYTGPDNKTWNYTYTAAGQINTIKDPNLNTTTYNYDASNRLSNIVNANSQTVLTLTYDAADRIATRTDSQGYVLTYNYDNLDRITKITYPDATTDLFDYTFQSGPNVGTQSLELRKYTDRLGRVTTYNFDADQRLTSVVEPVTSSTTRTTSYDYYENGVLKNLTDAKGNVTHWDIDIQSRPTSKTYAYGTPQAKTETYTYENSTSRLKSVTDALGQVKTYTWDKNDQLTGITYTSSVNATPNVSFTYDTYWPRRTTMVDGTGTTTYSYTAVGSLGALKPSSIAGPYTNDTLGLTYDSLGRLAGETISGGNESFGYDAISRLTTHTTPIGTFTNTYLGETIQQTGRTETTGSVTVSTSWGYDTNVNDRRLISITNSGVSRSFTLGYGTTPVNPYDIMSITDTAAGTHPWATQSHAYTYDYADRLLTGTSTVPGNFTYAYDALDNPTTWTTPAGTKNPTYNGLNQISTWGTLNYVYDANGNLTSGDGTKTYKWDAENRLIEIDYTAGGKSQFSYNGIGQRRIDVETASGGGTTTTRNMWCGMFVCQTRSGTDVVQRRQMAEGELNVTTGQKLIYMSDQLGAVRDVIDATTGTRVQSYDYEPYGAIARSNGTTPVDYQYASLMAHPASMLDLSATRAFDPATGRWLNKDPIREAGGINLYSYVGQNPVIRIDPNGHSGAAAVATWEAAGSGCAAFPSVCGGAVLMYGTGLAALGTGYFVSYYVLGGLAQWIILHNEDASEEEKLCTDKEKTNPYKDKVTEPVIVVDSAGNAIPVNTGQSIGASPDGKWQDVKDSEGNSTGVRIDGPHPTQADPAAHVPHAHVPGITTEDGNHHLPIYPNK